MGRSGYSDDYDSEWSLIRWRGAVTSAIRGKRGQAFLTEMLAALDAMPEKRLIDEELVAGGEVCAIGAVAKARGIDITGINPEAHKQLGWMFNIAPALVQEIEFINDDDFYIMYGETPEKRWVRVRAWVVEQLKAT